jgi:hypothetical protein
MVTNKMKRDAWINLVRASLDHSAIPLNNEINHLLERMWARTIEQPLATHRPITAPQQQPPTLWQRMLGWMGV